MLVNNTGRDCPHVHRVISQSSYVKKQDERGQAKKDLTVHRKFRLLNNKLIYFDASFELLPKGILQRVWIWSIFDENK